MHYEILDTDVGQGAGAVAVPVTYGKTVERTDICQPYSVAEVLQNVFHADFQTVLENYVRTETEQIQEAGVLRGAEGMKVRLWSYLKTLSKLQQPTDRTVVDVILQSRLEGQYKDGETRYESADFRLRYIFDLRVCHQCCIGPLVWVYKDWEDDPALSGFAFDTNDYLLPILYKLFAGDWEDLYGSQSDADMALLSILAFWCGCDEEQMDRIFRTSGLMRDKWDRKQAGSTYGAISIRNTVNTCSAVYMPVNAQDIVDEEFSKLDEDDYIEFQPDLTKITITLEEMAPHTNARYGRNEIGMGNMFADYFKQIARYNSERKGWYVYDGSVWRPDKGNLKVSELAKLLADKLYVFALTITEEDARKRFIDRVRKLQLRKNRETMLKDAMSVYPISMQAFDRNKYFFNCKNGTLDMRTLEFREHRPEDYLTMESGITYDPEADCPRWHSFIKEVMCGDADLADFLQRSLGYALTGDTSQECMFILYGATSRNGKGTAMETFLKIMGDYGKTSNPDMLAAKFRGGNTGGPSEEVARLVGSRFVNISEPEKKITFNAALVKRMTGNDTINARFLNENSFDFVPVFKIFINTNYLPNVNDMTLFQSGRLKIIPFNRHFEEGEQDQGLKGQFAKPENLSGIFNWCLEGYKKFCQRGLELPQAVTKATEDYKDDSDRIGQFIEAWLEKEDGSELRTAAAYQLYTKWCEENGYSSENQKNFKNAIGVHFKVVRKRPKGGGGQTTLIMDCKFKEVEAGAEDLTVQDAYKPKDSLL